MRDEVYIHSVTIENFQSHDLTSLEFDKNVNVIIGPSDSGKTAVFRALKWVFFNEPSGTDIIKKGKTEAIVTVNLSNGFSIVRGRSKSKNYYEIVSPDKKIERYEGFGVNVPQEVIDVSGINKIDLGNNNKISLNFAEQLESPFLITETPSVKANAVGRLAGVDKIDKALNRLSKDMHELNSNRKTLEKELNNQIKLLEKFDYLNAEKERIDRLEFIFSKVDNLKSRLTLVEKLKVEFYNNQERTKSTKILLKKFENLDTIDSLLEGLMLKVNSLKSLTNLNKRFSYTKSRMEDLNSYLNKVNVEGVEQKYLAISEKVDKISILKEKNRNLEYLTQKIENLTKYRNRYKELNKIINMTKELENMIHKIKILEDKFNNYKNLSIQEKKVHTYLKDLEDKYRNAVNFYINLLKEAAVCPFCYNKIDDEHISRILDELEV
ncbi:AAA family ATPase [Lagierella sp.]|uniref:AAA family ATPase n=1 Tax=Lagierella sp. TaxID=2849657 RepID=UPI002627E621|nr:AAA family ATPase [Lagierella sp.]